MKHAYLCAWIMAVCSFANAGNRLPELSVRNVGHYAICPWLAPNEPIEPGSSYDRMRNLDFTICNIFVRDDDGIAALDEVADRIIRQVQEGLLYDPPRTMIVRIDFWASDRYQGELQPFDVYQNRMKAALKALEPILDKIHGVSISEENITSDGRPAVLDQMYRFIKSQYPELRCYQWYTPNTTVPGTYENVFVSADGWIIDPYTLGPDLYPDGPTTRRLVQKYLVTGKPVVFIAPGWNYREFFLPGVAGEWFPRGFDGWKNIEEQLQVCLDYDLPVSWYWFYMKNDDVNQKSDDPWFPLQYETELGNRMTRRIHAWIDQVKQLPENYQGNPQAADRWDNPPLRVEIRPGHAIIEDEFTQVDFLDMTVGTGFYHLAWDGQGIALRAYNGKPPQVQMEYHIESHDTMRSPAVAIRAKINPSLHGKLVISLSADRGQTWTVFGRSRDDEKEQTVVADSRSLGSRTGAAYQAINALWIRIEMIGQPGVDDEPAVVLDSIRIGSR